jgi:SAM-dependent methyltransferase
MTRDQTQFTDGRRTYYDHERLYQRIVDGNGVGWDDHSGDKSSDSYCAVEEFLNSPFASFLGADRTALDLGCGGGQVAMMFAKRGCVTHGIDFSPTAVSLAKANANKAGLSIDFSEGDCLTLTAFTDHSIDVIADNHVWHCIVDRQDRRAFLQAAYRVLKRGGLIFSETMTREGGFSPSVMDANPCTFIARHHNRYWVGREEALEDLKSVGFEIFYDRLKPQVDAPGVGDLLIIYAKRP